jgi:hypothetical protein
MENTQVTHFVGGLVNNFYLWHKQFDHLGVNDLKILIERIFVNNLFFQAKKKLLFCQGCMLGK